MRTLLGTAILSLLASGAAAEDVDQCEALKQRTVGAYARCLLGNEARFTKNGDADARDSRRRRCRRRFDSGMSKAALQSCPDSHAADEIASAAEEAAATLSEMTAVTPPVGSCPIEDTILAVMDPNLMGFWGVHLNSTFCHAFWVNAVHHGLVAYCRDTGGEWICSAGSTIGAEDDSRGPSLWHEYPGEGGGVWNVEMSAEDGWACTRVMWDAWLRTKAMWCPTCSTVDAPLPSYCPPP